MNPPYQNPNAKNKGRSTLWNKFVGVIPDLCKDNGYVAAVHPSSWRSCSTSSFKEAKQVLKTKQIEYLEIHDEQDGTKTFGAATRYDWYILKNCNTNHTTEILDQKGNMVKVDLTQTSFIPNFMIDKVIPMIAKEGEERVEIISDFAYCSIPYEKGSGVDYVSKIKHDEFIHPVIYSVSKNGPTFNYSSRNDRGHFGIPKVIFNACRPIHFYVDQKGEYGVGHFCVGVVGDLKKIAEVISNQKTNRFAEFMEATHFTEKVFNQDLIRLLRKNFWHLF